MPPVIRSTTRALGIQLEGGRDHYVPGDTISGTIDRKIPLVAPRARVEVALHGRSKTKLAVPERFPPSPADRYLRDSFNFFAPGTTTQVLFDGPLHVEGNGAHAAWPFVFTIPHSMDEATARAQLAGETLNHVTLEDVGLRLPATFSYGFSNLAVDILAYVEYYLEATLRIYSESGDKCSDATLPLILRRAPDPRPPIADFALRPQLTLAYYKFVSHRLIPGREDAKLSSSQKVQRFFNSKHVPCLTVKYEAEPPGVIQLDHPMPVPFLLRAVPAWDQTSDAIYNVPQRIRLESVSMKITTDTTAFAWAAPGQQQSGNNEQVTELGGWSRSEHREAVYLPFMSDDPPLDIGRLMDLRLIYSGRVGHYLTAVYNSQNSHRLCPAFKTPNITHAL